LSCRAFDEIPLDIVSLGQNHAERRPGQSNDVVWEFAIGTEREFLNWRNEFQDNPG
jgi:hypothetical protein